MSTITESIGRVLADRYRIEAALGSGASANVYAAFDISLQRRVAIKVLHPALVADGAFLRRFRSEAQAAAALAHAHVLAVYDWGEDDRGPFLVLEFLGGGSLRDMLDEDRRLSVSQAVAVGAQAAEALSFAHGRGFVHRDVKPANLLFDTEGRLRVADFGLARALAEAALTEPAGATVGTARYAAPEQALGHRVDGRADVYSLALVLYESVTGVVPFTADTTLSTLMARVGERLPGHDALGPLAELLDAAAEPEPGDRIDAAEFATRLRALAEELPKPERLPLAGPGGGGLVLPRLAPSSPRAPDLTEHGMQARPPTGSKRALGRGEDPDMLAIAAAVGLTDEALAARRRRRRWPLVAAICVLVAGLAGGGVAFALHTTKLLVPSHKLPAIVGLTPDAANTKLHRDKLHVAEVNHRYSTTVATGIILRQIPGPGTKMKEGSIVQVVLSSGPPPEPVPSLASITNDCPGVTAALAPVHLTANCTYQNSTTIAKGTVIDWNPKTQAIWGTTVSVIISSGPPIVSVPSLAGSTCQAATATLQALQLNATCTQDYSSTVPSGQVIDWNPKNPVPVGTTITIDVSKGPQPVTIPQNLYGATVTQAIGELQGLGLNPVSGGGSLSGHVFLSDPAAGTSVLPGTTVTLYSR